MRGALIAGVTGQNGSCLAESLLAKGYEVHGIERWTLLFNAERIDHLCGDSHESNRQLVLHHGGLTHSMSLIRIIQEVQSDEIDNLAAQSHGSVSPEESGCAAAPSEFGDIDRSVRWTCHSLSRFVKCP